MSLNHKRNNAFVEYFQQKEGNRMEDTRDLREEALEGENMPGEEPMEEQTGASEPADSETAQAEKKEDKHDKFRRMAESRMNKAVDALRLIKNLSSSSYSYTQEEVEHMFSCLQHELDETKKAFAPKGPKAKSSFKFDD